MLNELDKELSRWGYLFVRYADESMIFYRSKSAAKHPQESIIRFIENSCSCIWKSQKLVVFLHAETERRDARVVEEARLESVYTPKGYHEFESRSLRKKKREYVASSDVFPFLCVSRHESLPTPLIGST